MDTCDALGSVALVKSVGSEPQVVLASEFHETAEDYSLWLLPAINRVLDTAGRRLEDVELYAAAAGPGSFTGIRIALTTAKAWNEVFHRPIAAVSRLEAMALDAMVAATDNTPAVVAASCDAQRGQLYGAIFRRDGMRLLRLGDERVVSPGELIAWAAVEARGSAVAWVSLNPHSLTSEPFWQARADAGEQVQTLFPPLAPAIAKVGAQMAEQNRLTDALSLDANYIRRPDAEVKWKGYSRPVV